MKVYEYIKLEFGLGDLSQLNNYSSVGWRVVCVLSEVREDRSYPHSVRVALLERELDVVKSSPEGEREK